MYNVCFNSGNTILVFKCGLFCPFDVFWMSMYAPDSLLVRAFHAWSNGQRQRLDYGCFGFIGHWLGTGLVGHCQGQLGLFKYNASTIWRKKSKYSTQRTIQFVRKITWKKLAVKWMSIWPVQYVNIGRFSFCFLCFLDLKAFHNSKPFFLMFDSRFHQIRVRNWERRFTIELTGQQSVIVRWTNRRFTRSW